MNAATHGKTSLLTQIRKLRGAEVAYLSTKQPAFSTTLWDMIHQYMRYLVRTWANVFHDIVFLSLNPIDFLVVLTYAFGGSVILGIMFLMCAMLRVLPGKILGFNIMNAPFDIFHYITQSQVDAACAALARPPAASVRPEERVFDVDIAKLLLQLSSLMYERGTGPILAALAAKKSRHGHNGTPGTEDHFDHDHAKDSEIRAFCRAFGLDYAPVSELNSVGSAYSALFWDPDSSWIVVAFKGTSPAEYAEWVSDINYALIDARDWLPGFSLVHGGFLERIFPGDVSQNGGIRPWDTITAGIKLVAKSLRLKNPHKKINLYFTGHSLGCAVASLAYARAILVEQDLGEQVVVRDGYIFAAPVLCDATSVKAFDGAINKDYDMPKTLWRITNMDDIVATGVPDYGDRRKKHFSRNSLLNFAHLGAEIKMRSRPVQSKVAGWPHITRGLPVIITSSLPENLMDAVERNQRLSSAILLLERLPLVGRFFQHAPNFYWDQLQRIGLGMCQWVKDD